MGYPKGLQPLRPDTYAYLRPPGGWGLSNCGLVLSGDTALLVDNQFDLPMTRELQAVIAAGLPAARVAAVVNTHSNGDHCWGNQLFEGAELIGSAVTAEEMPHEIPPERLAALRDAPGPLGDYARRHFSAFDFTGIVLTPPGRTFTGRLQLPVGERTVELLQVGPAHTEGDVIVHVPDAGVVFAGDILFIGDHPVMWTGPVENWIAACDLILDTGAAQVVPGHGPVTDPAGVRVFRHYLELVGEEATKRYAAGLPYWEAAASFPLPEPFARWGRPERLVITMAAAYHNLGAPEADLLEVLTHTAMLDNGPAEA